ncbi:hypothetical protein DSM112329_03187 [Paraconexibacter sp. AEG42_29]|uniref:Uncharacterized protein n=1 Tax=Paraconexibacter sp. AEG42_29 TaxID=2997339 RepID=A0AAU7AXI0_9ACTN
MIDITAYDRFVLRQRVKLVINQYVFSVPDGESDGEQFCFVEQKRFKFKEDVRFYTDDSKSVDLMRILARQRFDPRATYDIATADGVQLGAIQKVFGKSLFRSTYAIFAPDGQEICQAREVSMPKAIFRRVVGIVPYIGDFADWLPIAYDFEFVRGDQVLATNVRRRWKWRDVYDIDASGDTGRALDRRLLLAATVGMDALQAR